MLAHVRGKASEFRAETLLFVADPQIFTDVCELVCDAVYDFLYNDGFLDLPGDWRAAASGRPESLFTDRAVDSFSPPPIPAFPLQRVVRGRSALCARWRCALRAVRGRALV